MKIFAKMDKVLFFSTMFMFLFGLIMILSASNMESFVRYGASPYHFFFKQLIFILVGSGVFLFLVNVPTSKYKYIAKWVFFGLLFLLFILIVSGTYVNGAKSWINFMGFNPQPSEFIKVAFIVFLGVFYQTKRNKFENERMFYAMPLALGLLAFLLVLMQPDVGTAFILLVLVVAAFFALPISKKIKQYFVFAALGALGIGIISLFLLGSNFLTERSLSRLDFSNPCSNYQTTGYQVCNSYIAINNGGLMGVGFGNSTQKYLYLPEAHTDFIFSIVMEETGLIFSCALICIYFLILYRIYKISQKSFNVQNSFIAYLIGIYIAIHIVINLLGIFGRIPLTGVPLPFLSYGGSYAISLMVVLGVVQRIEIENKLYLKRIKKPK